MAGKRLHFLGIAGHTMRGIALAARNLGYEVTGTDEGAKPPGTDWLDEQNITWWNTPDAAHVEGVNQVVMTGGIAADNIEVVAAQKADIPIVSYAAFIGELIKTKRRLVVSGTHGKTTTSTLLTWILEAAGKKPDYVIGIQPRNFDTSVRLSDSDLVVLEGDEYIASNIDTKSKFMYYQPDVLIATSLEMDHPDVFKTISDIEARFSELIKSMPDDGRVLYWAGSSRLAKLASNGESYGEDGHWHADHILYKPEGISFDLYAKDVYHGHFTIPLYGRHNIDNATAAIAVALGEGLDPHAIQAGCATFAGAARRFQAVSKPHAEITVIDDYAHHPTEIATTIEAAKLHFGSRVIAIVRPHTYSRTKELLPEYQKAVAKADLTFVTDIEGAREAHLAATVSGADVAAGNDHVMYEPDRDKLVKDVVAAAKPGVVIICMTVSGYENLAEELAKKLSA